MNHQLISAHITTNWSGGTTTQLYIYPPESSVEARDFDFRISTAKVVVSESTFTPFLGYDRTLMILEGGIELHHKYHHQKVLNKFDQDFFKGDWETSSRGTCNDFNVITKPSFINKTEVHKFEEGGLAEIICSSNWLIIYLYKGELTINNEYLMQQGDVLVVSDKALLNISACKDSVAVSVELSEF